MELSSHKNQFESALGHLKTELSSINTGRAAPAAIENIIVDSYGAKMPLLQLASINSPEPNQLVVQPWDINNLKPIEKALQEADLGFGVAIQEKIIRLTVPKLTEERRLEIVKKLKQTLEQTKISIRQIREKIREEIGQEESSKQISEDKKYKLQEDLDKLTKVYTDKIEEIGKKKETEIMTI
ncbi:ribosome recycling factor [Candidatus Falkowbacteria bacterium]|nr:ribosome recycling factor [Candidatus Falkowbacteria bacterium]